MTDWGAYYQTRFQFDARRDTVWRAICKWLQPEIAETGTVVEFGAGYCHFINNIKAARKIAIDISENLIKAAAAEVETHIASSTKCDFLGDEIADIVFASNLLEHLTTAEALRTLREARRILKRNGKLIVVQPNFRYCYREYFDDYTHVSVFTDVSLCDLISSEGFEVRRLEPRFMPFSIKGSLPIAGWLVALYLRSPIRPKAGQMLVIAQKSS